MRIMQVIPEFSLGGAERMCANLSIALKKMGQEVIVVSLYNYESSITNELQNNGIKLIYLNKKMGADITIILKLIRVLKKYKPDVVHTHLYASKYAQIAAVLTKVKTKVHTIHNIAGKDGGKADQIINRILRKTFHMIPVSLSDDIRKTVMETYGISTSQTPIILNGVPLEKCKVLNVYKETATDFLHIGRFAEAKNHRTLIQAFVQAHKIVPELRLFLYGEGVLEQECKKLVSELDAAKYIFFCGTTNDPYTVMQSKDVFILPSLWEGVPMTLIEAMGSGMPIIASNVGGISDMLEDNVSALLIDSSAGQIADAILKIYSNRNLRKTLGYNAHNRANGFSAEMMAEKYYKVYLH